MKKSFESRVSNSAFPTTPNLKELLDDGDVNQYGLRDSSQGLPSVLRWKLILDPFVFEKLLVRNKLNTKDPL